ncbi:MAG: hypothetical protein QF441_06015 [Bacteriovoracaceae bacterium]|nr:hypothetical protein [Bacteriovoracaceae bacterium]
MLTSLSSYACSCMSSKSIIKQDLADWKANNVSDITITNLDTTVMPLAIYTVAKSILQTNEAVACDIGCSQYGIRITADVKYLEGGKNCTAKLTKPARYESKLFLDNILCM